MILSIVAYGHPILRKVANDIKTDYPNLLNLVANMQETMYEASGVGLAAPQIGRPIRLFVIDATPFSEDDSLSDKEREFLKSFQRVFVNAKITKQEGEEWVFREGCLSIPGINENVSRKEKITIEYLDEYFEKKIEVLDGLAARIVQHEYDHIEGILFTDKISSISRKIVSNKLKKIANGKAKPSYKMRFA